ncbi:MAG: hypothetical protein M1453_11965 [Acidobacteria bacterium]|nr:hypothetical protein [Acidobacteriota bacterium]MCL5288694.1 hypothetical protein [Acidobacteriota bacterium]
MKTTRMAIGYLVLALVLAGAAAAQEKSAVAGQEKPAASAPVKLQVTFSEFDGEKRVSSMPYTLSGIASLDRSWALSSMRMGLKVPIQTTTKEGQSQMQYMNVGTDIDARVEPQPDGRYHLNIQVSRSSVHTLEGATVRTNEFSGRPVLREFSSRFDFFLRDGQSIQTTVATDPVSGHVLKVDVTLNVVK